MARRRPVRIDMTPMVDVAFLLLIFFMSTTQFRPPEPVSVRLPYSSSEIHVPETDTIILTVNQEGRTYISSATGFDAVEVPPESLFDAVVAWRSRNPGAVVVLKGDRDADFGIVSDLMDVLAETKTLRFNLMTDLKKKGPGEVTAGAASASETPDALDSSDAPVAPDAPAAPEPGTEGNDGR